MEVLGDAVLATEGQHIAPQLFVTAAGHHFHEVRARVRSVPVGDERAPFLRVRVQRDVLAQVIGTEDVRLYIGVGRRLVSLVADLGSQLHVRLVGQQRFRSREHDLTRRSGHQPAQHLLPEHFVSAIGQRHAASASASFRRWQIPPCGHDRSSA